IGEEVVGIEHAVAQVFVGQTVILIGAALGSDADGSAGTAAVLGGVRIGGDLEFLDAVDGRADDLGIQLLNIFRNGIVVDAIHHEIVLQRANAVHVESTLAAEAGAPALI